jgi:hypothetical protein
MPGKFVYDPSVELKLARGFDMLLTVEAYALRGARGTRDAAPVKTGYYKDSIEHAVGRDARSVIGRVFSTDFAAHLIEFGSINNPAYAPLRNGVESTGLTVTDRRGKTP